MLLSLLLGIPHTNLLRYRKSPYYYLEFIQANKINVYGKPARFMRTPSSAKNSRNLLNLANIRTLWIFSEFFVIITERKSIIMVVYFKNSCILVDISIVLTSIFIVQQN